MGCITDLENRMKKADHYYEFSDDKFVYWAGAQERRKLIEELKRVPMNIAADLVQQFVPEEQKTNFLRHFTGETGN